MKIQFDITGAQTDRLLAEWELEHNNYYGQPYGARTPKGDLFPEEDLGAFTMGTERHHPLGWCGCSDGGFRWLTSGGNLGQVSGEKFTYVGRRHAIGEMAFPAWLVDELRNTDAMPTMIDTAAPGLPWWGTNS